MNEQKLHVTGNGTAHVSPDTICLTITIEGRCHDYGEALDKTAEKTDALKDLIEKLGFPRKDLKTVFVHNRIGSWSVSRFLGQTSRFIDFKIGSFELILIPDTVVTFIHTLLKRGNSALMILHLIHDLTSRSRNSIEV